MAHNAAFDLTTLLTWELVNKGYLHLTNTNIKDGREIGGQSLFVADDPPTIIELYQSNGTKFTVVDSMNFWRSSLAKIGESIGMPKLPMPDESAPITDHVHYCRNDVYILETAVSRLMRWVEVNGYGGLAMSAPSLAMGAWRTRFMPHPIHLHQLEPVCKLERKSYYGGRLEAFFIGERHEPIYNLDVCALYPYVMSRNLYPTELLDYQKWPSGISADQSNLDNSCIATVEINTERETFPVRTKNGVIFPTGSYITTLAGVELSSARNKNVIRRVFELSRYNLSNIFSSFVDHFWQQRAECERNNNVIEGNFCKLLMNSLYGKFGQMAPRWEFGSENPEGTRWEVKEVWDLESGRTYKTRYIGDRIEHAGANDDPQDHPNSFCAIASFVTAYGREYMRLIAEHAGWENIFYIVTDGIITNQWGYNNLCRSGFVAQRIPGKLSVKDEAEYLRISALHQYQVGHKITRGAIKPRAIEISDGIWRETHFEGLKSILAQNPRPGVCVYPVLKREPTQYYKAFVSRDGICLPWHLNTLVYSGLPTIEELRGVRKLSKTCNAFPNIGESERVVISDTSNDG